MRYVKDGAGIPLERIAEIRQKTDDKLKVFSGGGAATMITEMERGFTGVCPYTTLADVFSSAYDLWHAGKETRIVRYVWKNSGVREHTFDQLDRYPGRPRSVQTGYHDPRRASGWRPPGRVRRQRSRRKDVVDRRDTHRSSMLSEALLKA